MFPPCCWKAEEQKAEAIVEHSLQWQESRGSHVVVDLLLVQRDGAEVVEEEAERDRAWKQEERDTWRRREQQ